MIGGATIAAAKVGAEDKLLGAKLFSHKRELGVAAPIDADVIYYIVVGATSLPFINHAEARMLLTGDLGSDEQIDSHVAGILAMLLPGRRA